MHKVSTLTRHNMHKVSTLTRKQSSNQEKDLHTVTSFIQSCFTSKRIS